MDAYGRRFAEQLLYTVMPAFVFGVFLFLAMFFALLLAGRRLMSRVKSGSGPSAALGIVRERYARGELSRQEFEQMRSVLEG